MVEKKKAVIKKIDAKQLNDGKEVTEKEVHDAVAELGRVIEDKKNKRKVEKKKEENKEPIEVIQEHLPFITRFEKKRKEIAERETNFAHKYDCIFKPDVYLKTNTGRPTKFFKRLPQLMVQYFEESHWNMVIDEYTSGKDFQQQVFTMKAGIIPTIEGFGRIFRISIASLEKYFNSRRFDKDGNDIGEFSQEFNRSYTYCKRLQKEFVLKGMTIGLIAPNVGKFILSANHDMHEKKGLDINDSNETKKLKSKLKEVGNMTDDELDRELEELTDN